jgi:hypothetical protein
MTEAEAKERAMKNRVQRIYEKHVRKHGVVVGSVMQSMHQKGGVPLIDWLTDNTPKGVTVSDVLAGLALDAMEEDQSRNSGATLA